MKRATQNQMNFHTNKKLTFKNSDGKSSRQLAERMVLVVLGYKIDDPMTAEEFVSANDEEPETKEMENDWGG